MLHRRLPRTRQRRGPAGVSLTEIRAQAAALAPRPPSLDLSLSPFPSSSLSRGDDVVGDTFAARRLPIPPVGHVSRSTHHELCLCFIPFARPCARARARAHLCVRAHMRACVRLLACAFRRCRGGWCGRTHSIKLSGADVVFVCLCLGVRVRKPLGPYCRLSHCGALLSARLFAFFFSHLHLLCQ